MVQECLAGSKMALTNAKLSPIQIEFVAVNVVTPIYVSDYRLYRPVNEARGSLYKISFRKLTPGGQFWPIGGIRHAGCNTAS